MRTIERTSAFKRDYKREKKGQYQKTVEQELITVLELLVKDEELPKKYCDHALTGNMKKYRDCHVRPDLVLLYEKDDKGVIRVLRLVRLGSHSELGI